MAALEKGSAAPPFKLEDLDGQTHSLDDLGQDELLLLVFYHSECPTCQFAMPFIGNLARSLDGTRAKVWGVSQDDAKTTLKFARTKGLEMAVMVDTDPYPVSQAYGLTNVPTLFLIDAARNVIDQCVGFSKDDFVRIADALARHAAIARCDIFAGQEVPTMAYG